MTGKHACPEDVRPPLPEPEDRGTLRIAQVVLRRIAEHAADLVPQTARVPRRIAGVGVGEQGANARVSGARGSVDIRLDVALHYPTPVRGMVELVRHQVTDELRRIADTEVRRLDVTVSALLPEVKPRVE